MHVHVFTKVIYTSDFIEAFGKQPVPLNLGKFFIGFEKIFIKNPKIGKIKAIF